MYSLKLYIFIGGFTGGILLRSLFPAEESSVFGGYFVLSIFFILLALSLFSYFRLIHPPVSHYSEDDTKDPSVKRKKKQTVILIIFLFAAGLGVLRFDVADLNRGNPFLDELIETRIVAEGIVIDEPDERENNTKLTILFDVVSGEHVDDKVLVTANTFPRFSYGDKIVLSGTLKKPKNFKGEEGNEFDYISFLAKDSIFYQMFFPEIELLSEGNGNIVKHNLFTLKRAWLNNVGKVIPDPAVSLLGGLVVGAKRSLGADLQEDFRKTGIIHVVVLSGYNVTIVAEAIMRFFSFLPQLFGISIGGIAIIFFAILTGGSATVVRASFMALLVLLARATGRTYAITRALFIAGFFMILHNPKILVFDSSFQLSFTATIGLIYLAPKIEQYFKLVPTRWQLREFATATVATQLLVLPMILYKMGDLSLVALPVNLLILASIPITMLFGFITGVIGFMSSFLSLPFAFVTYALLAYQLKVVDLFASLPFASLHITSFPLWGALLLYTLYGLLIWKLHEKPIEE